MEFFRHLVASDFMPHGYCYLWDPRIVWLNAVSDVLITLSYYCIPIVLIYFIQKRRDLPFNWIFWMFGGFILACGTTHLMEVWNIWHSAYALAGIIKAITAIISVATVVRLVPLLPQAVAVPNLIQLQEQNRSLEKEIARRKRIDEAQVVAPLRRWLMAGIAVGVLLIGFMGFLSWGSNRSASAQSDLAAHAHAVMQALQITVKDVIETETSARGFALSGNSTLLAHYRASRGTVAKDIDALRQLTVDNATRERSLEREINAAIALADQMVDRNLKTHAFTEARVVLETERLMAAVQAAAQSLQTDQSELLSQRRQKTLAARRATGLITAASTLAGAVFLVLSGFAIRREVYTTARVQAQINLLNTELEQRVEQRTAALEETQARMTGIIASAMDSIITVDGQQQIVLFNAAAENMFRCPAADALGQSVERFIPQPFRKAHSEHIRKFEKTGVTGRAMGALGTLWAVRADGEQFQIEASISQVVTGGKRLFTVILRDVSERTQAEAARDRLAAAVESSDDAIISKTLNGTINAWNSGAEKLFGYSSSEALGQSILMLFPPERAAEESDIMAHINGGESVRHFETVLIRKDGKKIDVSSTISPIRDGSRKIVGASSIARDITERKRAEARLAAQAEELSRQSGELLGSQQALETQTRMLQSVLDSMAEGLVAADEQGKFIIWNPAAEKIVGAGATNLSSEHWSERYGLFLEDTRTPFPHDQNPLVRAIRGETSSAQIFVRNPGLAEGAWIEANGGPLRDKHGAVHGGVVAFRDITQKRTAEREIHRLNEELESRVIERTSQLEEANQELESFTYSVAHDLRAPLRHIAGFAGILVEEFGPALDAEPRRYLQRIQDGTHKMGQLVDELLSLARVGRQAARLQVAGLNTIVQEVIGILEPEIKGRQVEWKIADLPFVECDPTLLKQVFQNLISNAIKYSRPRDPAIIEIGQIDVGENTKRVQSAIFVRDNGVGFSMKHADQLFGVFQRLHRSEDFEGTGVGLAMVQRIIKKHQGRVWAEAELDKGATFYFTLGDLPAPEAKKEARTEATKETMIAEA
ncbi:MAG: PAS domain S-box protein [Terriglobales bacterium]